ncbi:hypothetical protein BDZ94DRAFT_1231146 [Collybia nuda]|uniref:Uncharacterized protein n=1 Tax=Collybia nuda TaxID=64659 RepID=A0A9P5YHP1_9AGAR|nr:hypothetical protein BDZ94DRAFT_1231146 [Collybia nuda]
MQDQNSITRNYSRVKQTNQLQRWMFLASTVTFLLATVHEVVELAVSSDPAIIFVAEFICIGPIATGSGLATTLYATSVGTLLIGYIYWIHRRDMVENLGKHRQTQAEGILYLVVESGVVYAVSFVLGFVPSNDGTPRSYATDAFQMAYLEFYAIYPTAVIALVNDRRTFDCMTQTNITLSTINYNTVRRGRLRCQGPSGSGRA